MASLTRLAPYDARRPRKPILTVGAKRGLEIAHVGSGEQSNITENLTETQRFETWLWIARNEWSVRSRSGLLGSNGRIGKHDADRALKHELAKIAGTGGE